MFMGHYRFNGNPDALLIAYRRLVEMVPKSNLLFHVCVADQNGLSIYDACPTEEIFRGFSGSSDFRTLLREVGLPEVTVTPLGEIQRVYINGEQSTP